MNDKTICWLAGILEGEGSFLKGPPSDPNQPRIQLSMTDRDIVERVASIFGTATQEVKSKRYKENGWKTPYFTVLKGRKAMRLMEELHPLMGERRQQQIEAALNSFDVTKTRRKLDEAKAEEIRKMIANGITLSHISREYGVDRKVVRGIRDGKYWKDQKSNEDIFQIEEELEPDWCWFAGLLEGEATFSVARYKSNRHDFPYINLSMTDLDVVTKASDLFGTKVGKRKHHKSSKDWYKSIYYVNATWTRAIEIATVLYPLMSNSRQKQIDKMLEL